MRIRGKLWEFPSVITTKEKAMAKHISQKLLEQYAQWYHEQKMAKLAGERETEPAIGDYVVEYSITEDVNDFIRATEALNHIGQFIQLDGES